MVSVGVLVTVGGFSVWVAVEVRVGGTGVKVGGTGDDVWVAVGGIGVQLGVKVKVGGRNGVQVGAGVRLAVGVNVTVGVNVKVAVSKLGVDEAPPGCVGSTNVVAVAGKVLVDIGVMLGVGVGVGFSGVSVQASQPMQ